MASSSFVFGVSMEYLKTPNTFALLPVKIVLQLNPFISKYQGKEKIVQNNGDLKQRGQP